MRSLHTALGAHDEVMRDALPGVYYCPLEIPADVETLDFAATEAVKENLYGCGMTSAVKFFSGFLPLQRLAGAEFQVHEHLRSMYGDRLIIETALSGLVAQVEAFSEAVNVRASIMLPTGRGTRIVVYSFRFDECADQYLEIPETEGVSGQAHLTKDVVLADLTRGQFGISQVARVHKNAQTMMSFPIFGAGGVEGRVIGTMNIDTPIGLEDSGWSDETFTRTVVEWTWVFAALFRPWRKSR